MHRKMLNSLLIGNTLKRLQVTAFSVQQTGKNKILYLKMLCVGTCGDMGALTLPSFTDEKETNSTTLGKR